MSAGRCRAQRGVEIGSRDRADARQRDPGFDVAIHPGSDGRLVADRGEGAQEPVRDRVMPGIRDARDVLDKLSSSRVALFLHGHLHEADSYTVISDDWQTAVCCAGTSGASAGWLRSRYRDNQGNSLGIYAVEDGRIAGRMIAYDERIRRSPQPVVSFLLEDQQLRIPGIGERGR